MLTIILSTNITVTSLFMMMKHPLSMGICLLMQTILVSLVTSNLNQNSWFSYILFLIMVGGMLILFMYMTSVASNEKFKTNLKLAFLVIIIPILFMTTKELTSTSLTNNETSTMKHELITNMSMNKFINMPLSITLTFLMIYLLLVLIATVKITEFKKGSIRQMN